MEGSWGGWKEVGGGGSGGEYLCGHLYFNRYLTHYFNFNGRFSSLGCQRLLCRLEVRKQGVHLPAQRCKLLDLLVLPLSAPATTRLVDVPGRLRRLSAQRDVSVRHVAAVQQGLLILVTRAVGGRARRVVGA